MTDVCSTTCGICFLLFIPQVIIPLSLSLDEIIDTRTNFVETIESHIERIDRIVDD